MPDDDEIDTTPDAPVAALEPEDERPPSTPATPEPPAIPVSPASPAMTGPPAAPRPPADDAAVDAARRRFAELATALRQPRPAARLLGEYLRLRLRLNRGRR